MSAINTAVAEGKLIYDAAKTVLRGLGKPDAESISVAETADAVRAFNGMQFNGDGVLPPDSAGPKRIKH